MLRRLHDDITDRIKPAPPRPPRDLTKIPHTQNRRLLPVIFPQLRKYHRANRHIDPHAQRVRPADQFKQPLLRELLHQNPILRQQPRVMHAHAMPQPTLHFLAIRTREPHALQRRRDGRLLLLRAHIQAHQTLRRLRRRALREMHQINRRTLVLQQRRQPLDERRL